ncbi:MAG TPA: ABC transporter substrate-binding protein [Spirochaetia bacterium]|nr:ABC transporter substrate-binding protein [Spirochaetia bacterium]
MKKTTLVILCLSVVLAGAFAGGQKETNKPLTVGATFGDLGNPFFYTMGKGVTDAAKKIDPNAKVSVLSCGYDLNTQVGQIDTFISSGVDIIILNAADTKGIAPAVKKAKAAGIIVVAADVNADGGVDAMVTSNNRQAGEQCGEYIAKRLGGKGSIVIVNGPPVSAVIDRVDGCKSVLAKYPDIKILSENQNAGGNREGGLRVMTDLLTAFPKIDAVFAINDPTGIGCDLAIKQAKREGEMFVAGVDGAPDAVVALNDKTSTFAASASQDPYTMAIKAVEIAWDVKQGKKPDQLITLIPTTLITRENVASYKGWTKPE